MKKFLALLLILPVVTFCNPENNEPDGGNNNGTEQNGGNTTDPTDPAYAKAAPEVKNGDVVLATNPNVEKFLTEVTYQDKDYSTTKIYDYYGGFNCKKYNENGELDDNGKEVTKPVSDRPSSYSIRWKADEEAGEITVHLADKLDWSTDIKVTAGKAYVDITNLVPNDEYTYKATASNGKIMAEGKFTTTGHMHQVTFKSDCRNGRDLGGWKTESGKTVRYRRLYRTGRWDSANLSKQGKADILAEGFGGQLDLRGKSDVLSVTTVPGLEFCAPGIEQGGTAMLNDFNEKGENKTAICFEFALQQIRKGKGVAFHCSLGRDRTGTLAILFLGLLGVPEHDIAKEYECTYFAPMGYSVSSSEEAGWNDKHPDLVKQGLHFPYFLNTRCAWVYTDVVPYFWQMAGSGSFASGVEKYLLEVAKVPQADIDEFRNLMLVD